MKEEEEILPYPFCGCKDIVISPYTNKRFGDVEFAIIRCTKCSMGRLIQPSYAAVIKVWNRRA
jgi:Lar family restriction alleviation protein